MKLFVLMDEKNNLLSQKKEEYSVNIIESPLE